MPRMLAGRGGLIFLPQSSKQKRIFLFLRLQPRANPPPPSSGEGLGEGVDLCARIHELSPGLSLGNRIMPRNRTCVAT